MNYVCLDVGNVLVHVDFQIFIRDLSKQLNITLEEAEYFMNRTHALHDMGLTKMADELRDHFKIKVSTHHGRFIEVMGLGHYS